MPAAVGDFGPSVGGKFDLDKFLVKRKKILPIRKGSREDFEAEEEAEVSPPY